MSKMIPNSTQVPNYIFDELWSYLTPQEFGVLMYIARRTYGFQKQTDAIALSQFTKGIAKKGGELLDGGTGMTRNTIRKALKSLVSFNIVIVVKEAVTNPPAARQSAEYRLNLDDAKIDFPALMQRKENKTDTGIRASEKVKQG